METQLDHERGPEKIKEDGMKKEDEKLVASMLDDRANGRDAQTAVDIISDINREEPEATVDGLDDMDVNQPLNSPSDVASREESRKRKSRNRYFAIFNEFISDGICDGKPLAKLRAKMVARAIED
ncbi:hypothetical protein L1987_05546 [Smallanthus sonchifolius]|uniref:Uncharacterized protein n=1 Tax=Smallanthus sonchifolius TaxID=185202 RepID=A0ACB9JVM3_9ASTR|nr:hypothetical protein L1987_05546 [Smallanthus sonchifolius]